MTNEGGPPTRHLHPVEPPFDPDYDSTPTSTNRTPGAHANTIERALLGHLLTTPELAPSLATELEPADFYNPHHATLWEAIHKLSAEGTTPDHVALVTHLARTGELTRIGGDPYLLDLRDAAELTTDPTYTAKQIRDASRLRTIANTAARLSQIANSNRPDDIDTALADALDTLDHTALRFGPRDNNTRTGLHDLTWILHGEPPVIPPPTICQRTDGTALFYDGKVNGIFGDPEAAKTWLAQAAGVEALNNGGTLAMIDVDHNGPHHTSARLLLLGVQPEHIADPNRFRYYEPDDPDELRAAVDDITHHAPTVVIIDSLGEIFPMLGVNTNDGDEMTTAMRLVCTRPAVAGSCVITIDHLPKSAEARTTGYAIGSIAKKRMIRGSYLRAEARTQPAPGAIGRITLRIEKDTAGELRKSSGGGYAGTFTLDSTQYPHAATWSIAREEMPKNDDGSFRPTSLMEKVSRHIEDNDQCTFTDIKEHVSGKDKWLRDAIQVLVTEGFVARIDGARRAKLHHTIAPYRETEDDHVEQSA